MTAAYDISGSATPFPTPPPSAPQVFPRIFTVPPGAPWEQARAANLEVRHGSPLPISELIWRLRRLEAWRPGRPGRYAVFYVRSREYAAPFETEVDIDGVALKVAFGAASDQLRQAQRAAAIVALVAATAGPIAVGTILAIQARSATSQAIENLDRVLAAKAKLAGRLEHDRLQERELQKTVADRPQLDQVLADLRWVSAARTPDARIEALHWDHGLLAVEARGEYPPIAGSGPPPERSSKPVRPGVWLWGLKTGAAGHQR